ncbi:MAG: response regulator [Methanosarcina sp.]|uniref:response regulator n=1 Tax=Methanosarcina sp. TaxID=2213 RepID=UPI00260B1F03|nr:response regulator [Methanosarcina sp.]MDD3247317.1 response regulator [Methanosarcina sp.]MDD4247979.1 response regulator [Methanosarcina sp.]
MASILVVEDNPMNLELVTCLLESNGIEVTQAVDGLEALDMIKNSLFDLVLLDIQLPGMGGLEVLKYIKENPASQQIGVVALTAQALVGDEQRFIDAGCIGYISKPIDVFQFMDQLNAFFGNGKA